MTAGHSLLTLEGEKILLKNVVAVVLNGSVLYFFKDFCDKVRLYRGQILLMGGFAGWLWSFPLYGPVLAAAGSQRGTEDLFGVFLSFLALHAAGLVVSGYLLAGVRADRLSFYFSVTVCALLTMGFALVSPRLWPYLGGMLGVAAAPFVVAWGRRLAVDVRPAHRGLVVALSFITGAAFNAAQTYSAGKLPASAGLLASSLLLLIPVFTALALPPVSLSPQKPFRDFHSFTTGLNNWWQFALLVFVFYLTGGLMYWVIQPVIGQNLSYSVYLGTFSYGVAGLIAGHQADHRGRGFLPLTGVGLVGASFALFAFWPGIPVYIMTHVIIQSGFVCLDLFVWLYLADRAAGDPIRASRYYGWGLCLNVFSVLVGTLAGNYLQKMGLTEHHVKASLLAGLVLFTSFPILAWLRESLSGGGKEDRLEPACEAEPVSEITFEPMKEAACAAEQTLRLKPRREGRTSPGTSNPGISENPVTVLSNASVENPNSCSLEYTSGVGPAFSAATLCAACSPEMEDSFRDEQLKQIMAHLLDYGFTHREIDVALLVLEGLDNTAIALRLNISKNTLKTHLRSIYKKAKANGKVSFILWVQELVRNQSKYLDLR